MSLQTNASRFAFLMDDAPDPFESVKKKKASTPGGGDKSKTASGKKSNNKKKPNADNKNNPPPSSKNDQKLLLSMAFGSNKKVKNGSESKPGNNGGTDGGLKGSKQLSPDDPQYEEWKQRDLNFVSGTFESDLEAALMQSKLDFQKEKLRAQNESKPKSKKKAAPIPLSDFNASIANHGTLFAQPPRPAPSEWDAAGDGNMPMLPEDEIEKMRREAQLELKRELQLEQSRELMQSRTYQVPLTPLTTPAVAVPKGDTEYRLILEEKDAIIAQMSEEKRFLEEDSHKHKERFKKVMNLIEEAKLKETVMLLAEVEHLKKIQQQLTEEISSLHSQLEQERSKAHTATLECKKLEQSRRRTTSTTELN